MRRIGLFTLSLVLLALPAASQDLPVRTVLDMLPGTEQVLELDRHHDRILAGNEGVAAAKAVGERSVAISAGQPGRAPILILDTGGEPILHVEVRVADGFPGDDRRAVTVRAFSPKRGIYETRSYFIGTHPAPHEAAGQAAEVRRH
jgi:Flp pilus assembly secretin CpaC